MSYRAEIDRLLASPPPDWKRQWRNARVQLRALGYKAPALPDATKALMALSLTAGGRRSGDRVVGTVPVPPAVREEAMRAVRMAHRFNYGAWNFIGLARAIQLATIPRIDARSVERMRGFFTRHAKDAEAAGFGDDAHPSRGYLAHLVWGGDPAKEWVMGMEKRARKNPEVTETPAFKCWFGNSKVIDADGKPLPVYHGTFSDFSAFDYQKSRGINRLGFWFDAAVHIPNVFAGGKKIAAFGGSGSVMPVYLSLQNPKEYRSDPLTRDEYESLETLIWGAHRRLDGMDFPETPVEQIIRRDAKKLGMRPVGLGDLGVRLHSVLAYLRIRGWRDAYTKMLRDLLPESETAKSLSWFVDNVALVEAARERLAKQHDGVILHSTLTDTDSLPYVYWTHPDAYRIRETGSEVRHFGNDWYLALYPTQIKSTTGNRGTFDPTDADIRHNPARVRRNPEDYRMRHRPSEDGPLASDMGTGEYMPKDVLTHPHYYTGFRTFLSGFWPVFRAAQGKPAARLTVYRALPSEHTTFRSGDWVTPSLSYAKTHLESNVEGGHIVAASVPASTLRFAGDDLMEWGYWGPTVEGTPARVRRNPLAQPSPTMAFSFRKDAIPGVVEVYLYEPEELDDPARSLVGGAMLTLAAGDRWETQGMAACPGYGPLVYDLAASVLQQRIHATSDQTEAAKRFWARQGKRYIAPMKPEAFAKKYGVTPKELFLRGYELTADDYRRMGDELSTVFWGAKEAEKKGKLLALLRCAVPNGRRRR